MKRTSADSMAMLTVKRLKKLPVPEQLRQIQIILKAEKPYSVLRFHLQRQHVLAKAEQIRSELPPRRKRR